MNRGNHMLISSELPPRARRIHAVAEGLELLKGTTSACAENTFRQYTARDLAWNYLRVRGEYHTEPGLLSLGEELPPRARRILRHGRTSRDATGTTSACAENTP